MSFYTSAKMRSTYDIKDYLIFAMPRTLKRLALSVIRTRQTIRKPWLLRPGVLMVCCVLLYMNVHGQTLSTFTHYSTEMGFVQKEVMKLAQDNKGQMWFATWNGLYKFDGYRFSNYKARPGDGVRMESNRLESVSIDGDNVWMRGYNGSISCFNTLTEEILDLPLTKYVADETYPVKQGGILITMSDNRLIKATLNAEDAEIKAKEITGFGGNKITRIANAPSGMTYVLTTGGLYSYKNSDSRLKQEWRGYKTRVLRHGKEK